MEGLQSGRCSFRIVVGHGFHPERFVFLAGLDKPGHDGK
jgi:hypothetical protein